MSAAADAAFPMQGRCNCGALVYEMATAPMATHCCHCRWCQRQTGASFALHAMIEASRLKILSGEPELVTVPSPSGAGQTITRCSKCHFPVWSAYLSLGAEAKVLRSLDVGTLDNPDACPPDFHIYTRFKQPWVFLPDGPGAAPVFKDLYDRENYWTEEQLQRRKKAILDPPQSTF